MSGPGPERLDLPTDTDVAWRLGVDAEALAARLDAFHGPVPDEVAAQLEALVGSVRDLVD